MLLALVNRLLHVADRYARTSMSLHTPGETLLANLTCSQVRFELAFKACNPSLKVIAPWRLPEFCDRFEGRQALLKFAAENNIPVSSTPKAPWSQDENLVHCSYEAGILEDPDHTPPEDLWTQTVDPLKAPDQPFDFAIHFEKGIPVKVVAPDQTVTGSVDLFKFLNKIGHDHGIGRIDM